MGWLRAELRGLCWPQGAQGGCEPLRSCSRAKRGPSVPTQSCSWPHRVRHPHPDSLLALADHPGWDTNAPTCPVLRPPPQRPALRPGIPGHSRSNPLPGATMPQMCSPALNALPSPPGSRPPTSALSSLGTVPTEVSPTASISGGGSVWGRGAAAALPVLVLLPPLARSEETAALISPWPFQRAETRSPSRAARGRGRCPSPAPLRPSCPRSPSPMGQKKRVTSSPRCYF